MVRCRHFACVGLSFIYYFTDSPYAREEGRLPLANSGRCGKSLHHWTHRHPKGCGARAPALAQKRYRAALKL